MAGGPSDSCPAPPLAACPDRYLFLYAFRIGCRTHPSRTSPRGARVSNTRHPRFRATTGKSCRLRWVNELRDGLSKAAFSDWEVAVLVRAVHSIGNKWANIAKLLPGRTDNSVKNRWNCSIKKKLHEYVAGNPFLRDGKTLEWLLENPNAALQADEEPQGGWA